MRQEQHSLLSEVTVFGSSGTWTPNMTAASGTGLLCTRLTL
jgi:hypothetical protein